MERTGPTAGWFPFTESRGVRPVGGPIDVEPASLLPTVERSADWVLAEFVSAEGSAERETTAFRDMLVLLAFAYLRGASRSQDVVRLLDTENVLFPIRQRLGLREEHVRNFRRERRGELVACMTDCLEMLRERPNRSSGRTIGLSPMIPPFPGMGSWEGSREWSVERIDEAVLLDSMALDD